MPPVKKPSEEYDGPSADRPRDDVHGAYLEALRALQARAERSEEQLHESSRALLETNRSSLEQLARELIAVTEHGTHELAEVLLARSRERLDVSIQQQPPAEDPTTREQRLRQRELVLSYNGLRTMLGRAPTSGAPGAAVVFQAQRVTERGDPDPEGESILILGPAPFAAVEGGWTLVATTTQGQTLPAQLHQHDIPLRVQVPHLTAEIDIGRLEIRDQNGDPIFLGVGPVLQTDNAQAQPAGVVAQAHDGGHAGHGRGRTTVSTEFDRGTR